MQNQEENKPKTKNPLFYKDDLTKRISDRYLIEDPDTANNFNDAVKIIPRFIDQLLVPPVASRIKGLPELDRCFGGLRPREFTILCGATGVGKSTLCANISSSLITSKIPHCVFSVETGDVDYVARVASALLECDYNDGEIHPPDVVRVVRSEMNRLLPSDLFHVGKYEDRVSVEQIISDIYSLVVTKGIKVAIVDNLNFLMDVTTAANQIIEMDRVIHDLIIFCKQVDVHIIMVMHPRKTEGGRVERIDDIKGSSTAVQEAQNVILFNRLTKESIETMGYNTPEYNFGGDCREIKIAKLRRKGGNTHTRIFLRAIESVRYQEIKKVGFL